MGGGGFERERQSRKAAWDQKTFTSRLRVGFFAALGKENKKKNLLQKVIQYESRGGEGGELSTGFTTPF